jgi:hypothetical protein
MLAPPQAPSMNIASPTRVSRETRMLIATIAISLVALWVLARLRFPDREAAPAPVPAILTPLVRPSGFADLAAAVSDTHALIAPFLFAWPAAAAPDSSEPPVLTPALRIGGDLAVALTTSEPQPAENIVGRDRATGLTVITTPPAAGSPPATWSPRQLQQPRYLFAASVAPAGSALRPLFVDGLSATETPLWPAPLWTTHSPVDATPGSFVFASDGSLAGLVVEARGRRAIVPGETVLREADRVRQAGYKRAGRIGVDVRGMTPALAAAIGEASGVVVAWVDPLGAAAEKLMVGDLVVSIDGVPTPTVDDWTARTARLAPGDTMVLHLRRQQAALDLAIVAADAAGEASVLGLAMRAHRGLGTEVVAVSRGSVAERSGMRAGDVITTIGTVTAPSPAEVARVFNAAREGGAIPAAITRGGRHDIVALVKR